MPRVLQGHAMPCLQLDRVTARETAEGIARQPRRTVAYLTSAPATTAAFTPTPSLEQRVPGILRCVQDVLRQGLQLATTRAGNAGNCRGPALL